MFSLIDVKWKGKTSRDTGYNIWLWTLNSFMTLTLDVSRTNCEKAVSQELLVWCEMKRKGINRILGQLYDLPFDHTHDLDLGGSRPDFKIAFSHEWDGWLTWKEKDVSHPLWPWYWPMWSWWGGWMYRIMTGVTSDVTMPSTYLVI